MAALLALVLISVEAVAGEVAEANRNRPGQILEIKSLLAAGKTTLIDFFSPYCPPCLRLAPLLAQLADKRPELAIQKVNINRPEVKGIDWGSPLARQYRIRQVPYFMIFDSQGKLLGQGPEAMETVGRWLQEAGLMK